MAKLLGNDHSGRHESCVNNCHEVEELGNSVLVLG